MSGLFAHLAQRQALSSRGPAHSAVLQQQVLPTLVQRLPCQSDDSQREVCPLCRVGWDLTALKPALETGEKGEDAQRTCKLTCPEAKGWCPDTAAVACLRGYGSAGAGAMAKGLCAAAEVQSHAEYPPRACGGWWGVGRLQCMLCLWVWMRGGTKEQAWGEQLTH